MSFSAHISLKKSLVKDNIGAVMSLGASCSQHLAGLLAERVDWQGLAPGGLGEQAGDGV